MAAPEALSVFEIRNYMLANNCKVTNHALVKHFKRFLTGPPDVQSEARKKFKTYVNLLATIKNENNQKYLILRKKYINECPTEEAVERAFNAIVPSSPSNTSIGLDTSNNNNNNQMSSPSPRQPPPPYKPPPEVTIKPLSATSAPVPTPLVTGIGVHKENVETYGECVQEFAAALRGLGRTENSVAITDQSEMTGQKQKSVSRLNSVDETVGNNKENIPRFSFSSGASGTSTVSSESSNSNDVLSPTMTSDAENNNPISVKEATRKFNRMASEEEAKVLSPPVKKKPESAPLVTKDVPPVSYSHPKAKEWIITMAKSNYQALAKLAHEYPELTKLQDPATGYTALHWAAKHGNEDVVKLMAGTHKADVNARTNGGYTPLHIAVQFGRNDILELLCNVYKADRDIMDWSGNKPLDYSTQKTSVSQATYSKIKALRKNAVERDLSFLRIGSLNVRVKKTTEAFSNFLGVGGNGNGAATIPLSASQNHARRSHHVHASKAISTPLGASNSNKLDTRASMPAGKNKSWGSADNIPHSEANDNNIMPPPKSTDTRNSYMSRKRGSVTSCTGDSPRLSISSSNSSSYLNSGYSSMPTTPNQLRSPHTSAANSTTVDSDSDSACGFGSQWSVGDDRNLNKM